MAPTPNITLPVTAGFLASQPSSLSQPQPASNNIQLLINLTNQDNTIDKMPQEDLEEFPKFDEAGYLAAQKEVEEMKAKRVASQPSTTTPASSILADKKAADPAVIPPLESPFVRFATGFDLKMGPPVKFGEKTEVKIKVDPYTSMSDSDSDYDEVEHHENGGGRPIGNVKTLYEELAEKREEIAKAKAKGLLHTVVIPEHLRACLKQELSEDENEEDSPSVKRTQQSARGKGRKESNASFRSGRGI